MVALAVQELGRVRPVCFARTMLLSAEDDFHAGSIISAGVKLREAARMYLEALCTYHNCQPPKQHSTPGRMAETLRRAGHLEPICNSWMRAIIEAGNAAAHCRPLPAREVITAIELLHIFLDKTPEVIEGATREGGAVC